MSYFSEMLKTCRKNKKLTQKQLADILNVSQNAVFNWENEKCEPSIDMINKIADFFRVSVDMLIRENTYQTRIHSMQTMLNTLEKDDDTYILELIHNIDNGTLPHNISLDGLVFYLYRNEYTTEELLKIKEFAEFVKSQRKK